jgi:hypothetical protein
VNLDVPVLKECALCSDRSAETRLVGRLCSMLDGVPVPTAWRVLGLGICTLRQVQLE